jgi:hypothetical protein
MISNQSDSVKTCSVLSENPYCTVRRIDIVNLLWSSELNRQLCNFVFPSHWWHDMYKVPEVVDLCVASGPLWIAPYSEEGVFLTFWVCWDTAHWQMLFTFEINKTECHWHNLPLSGRFLLVICNETRRFGSRLCFHLQARKGPTLLDSSDRALLSHWAPWVSELVEICTWEQVLSKAVTAKWPNLEIEPATETSWVVKNRRRTMSILSICQYFSEPYTIVRNLKTGR